MDAGNLGFSPCAQRSIRRFAGYDFLRYRPFLYDYGFRSYLPQSQKTKHGKALQNMALSHNAHLISIDRQCILYPVDLVQTSIYMAWFPPYIARFTGVLVYQQTKNWIIFFRSFKVFYIFQDSTCCPLQSSADLVGGRISTSIRARNQIKNTKLHYLWQIPNKLKVL